MKQPCRDHVPLLPLLRNIVCCSIPIGCVFIYMHVHCTAARFFYSLCCWPRDRVTLASLATSRDSDIARLQHKLATSRDSIKRRKKRHVEARDH